MSSELSAISQQDNEPDYLEVAGGRIAYHHMPATNASSNQPGVMFLGGFMSDMTGTKATFLEQHCKAAGLEYTRFDYFGHGQSSGAFEDGTIGQWAQNALDVLEQVTQRPQILVGSSMGGWIMLLAALKQPEKVKGLVGIAAAPDFTERLMWDEFDDVARKNIEENGVHYLPNCYGEGDYPITRALIEDGREQVVLEKPIPLTCPVRLLQGMQDVDVPWKLALGLAEKLESTDVQVQLLKDADHRMSEPEQLALLARVVDELIA